VAAIMRKPFTHNLAHGVMTCGDCHNPHGGRGRLGFKQRSLEATCAECHADTSGPHVFEHVTGFVGDCTSCHESHGSSNPRQLTRASISQLCLECHSTLPAGELGSQPPSSHNLRSPRYRDCTVCHTAVHGSSRSPLLLK
jgi:DmsE family decaheme c-type cytochrome